MKMPPKKRDKDEGSKIISRDIQAEHELFLQAFEKPTQIYRYLRTRNMISPVFLHRTLTYMKHRMSRNHKRRTEFKIDNMLAEKLNKTRLDKNFGLGNYMSLMFLGFFDKTLCDDFMINNVVRVETILLKISHKKRKDSSSSYMQESFGTSEVLINPNDDDTNEKIPAISIPTESFTTPINGTTTPHNQSSYILLLKVEAIPKLLNNYMMSVTDDSDLMEPCSKRQRSAATVATQQNATTKVYGSELIIFDKHSRCLLAEGEYELALSEILSTATIKNSSPKKHTTWEIIPDDVNFEINDKFDNRFDLFNKCPTLKFYLKWTNEPCTGYVSRPKSIPTSPLLTNKQQQSGEITQTTNDNNDTEKENNNSNNNNNLISSNKNGSTAITTSVNNNCRPSSSSISLTPIERIQTVYQFIYNNNSRQQTEPCDDMHCPWCSLDCMTLYSLLKHLKLCHARFTFTYVPVTNGARIDVAINDMYDGSYTGSPHDLVGPATGCAFARGGPVRRTIVTNLLVCRPRRQKPSLTEFLELDENELNNQRPYITGHNRLYHHTETCLPVHPKELDIDSEGESDPLWLQHKTMQMIDEFTDVNEGEKELMKMWNLHVMKHGYVGDCQLPIACDMFLDMRGHELLQKNLYRNFILHMCSLFDYGLVSPEVVYKTIQKLQNILSTYPEGRKVMAESREAQLDYWLKIGIHKQIHQEELKQKQQQEHQLLRKQQHKQNNNVKSSIIEMATATSSFLASSSSSPNDVSGNLNKKTGEKDKLLRDLFNKDKDAAITATKTISGNNIISDDTQIQHNATVLQRKRSSTNVQNEQTIMSSKRRLSQLRDSPPRRRSVPSSEHQQQSQSHQQPKLMPPRRKSVALFNLTADKNNTNLSSSSSPTPNQTSMRKRISSITKVDKH